MISIKDEIFFKVSASPYFWRKKAEELKYASEIIWPHAKDWFDKVNDLIKSREKIELSNLGPCTFSIYLSLIGFSIECMFKASAIRDNPQFVSNGVLSKKLYEHDLINLSKVAKINLTQFEAVFCRQTTRAMVIESRYPISKRAEVINRAIEIGGHCKEIFEGLFNRIYPTVGQINKISHRSNLNEVS